MSIERFRFEGQCQTISPAGNTIEIPLPQLPFNGTWSLTGTVLAVNPVAPIVKASAVAAALTITGITNAGQGVETDTLTPPYTLLPASGGLAVSLTATVGTGVGAGGQTLYLTLVDAIGGATVVWGWSLDIVALSLP